MTAYTIKQQARTLRLRKALFKTIKDLPGISTKRLAGIFSISEDWLLENLRTMQRDGWVKKTHAGNWLYTWSVIKQGNYEPTLAPPSVFDEVQLKFEDLPDHLLLMMGVIPPALQSSFGR
jgi:DNA-binding Lrp family transcriptional regulator